MRDLNDTPLEPVTPRTGVPLGNLTSLHGTEPATPGWTPGPSVDGSPKPYFPEGTRVAYSLGIECCGYGTIRGLAMQHVIDIWIVEREPDKSIDLRAYPWSCITVPHTCLKRV